MTNLKKIGSYLCLSLIGILLIAIAALLAMIVVNDVMVLMPAAGSTVVNTVMVVSLNLIIVFASPWIYEGIKSIITTFGMIVKQITLYNREETFTNK